MALCLTGIPLLVIKFRSFILRLLVLIRCVRFIVTSLVKRRSFIKNIGHSIVVTYWHYMNFITFWWVRDRVAVWPSKQIGSRASCDCSEASICWNGCETLQRKTIDSSRKPVSTYCVWVSFSLYYSIYRKQLERRRRNKAHEHKTQSQERKEKNWIR